MSKAGTSLLGLLNEEEALGYFAKHVVLVDNSPSVSAQKWHDAQNRLKPYAGERAGQPEVLALPPEANDHLKALESHSLFPRVTMGLPYSFGLVEIDPLLCFQLHSLSDVVDDYSVMAKAYRRTRNLSDLLPYCLPTRVFNGPATVAERKDLITVTSRDLNLHLLGTVEGQGENNAKISGFAWGPMLSLVQVVHLNGRYVLRNGYHRALALRRQGVTHVPALLMEAVHPSQVGVEEIGHFQWRHLDAERPPVVGLLAGAMAYPVQIREMVRVFTISIVENFVPVDL